MRRPETHEYDPYYETYTSLVEGNAIDVLDAQPAELKAIFESVPEEKGHFAYSEGKWSIKELLSHLIDGERMFAYRILRISRGDATPIEGFEQDGYIENSNANNRCFAELIEEFDLQRRSNMLMLKNIPDDRAEWIGIANDKQISVRALCYILAGHFIHHMNIIKTRYLV